MSESGTHADADLEALLSAVNQNGGTTVNRVVRSTSTSETHVDADLETLFQAFNPTGGNTGNSIQAWGEVTDVMLSHGGLGTKAALTLTVHGHPRSPFTHHIEPTFAENSPRLSRWCRIGARIPIIVVDGPPVTVVPAPSRDNT